MQSKPSLHTSSPSASLFYPTACRQILGGLTVAGGAVALTQSAWILKWNGLFAVLSTIAAFGLLALIGKRDLQASLTAIRNARKREAQQVAG